MLTIYYNIVKTNTISNNDLHHLALDTKNIKEELVKASDERKAQSEIIFDVGNRISKLEGSVTLCQALHGKKLEKKTTSKGRTK